MALPAALQFIHLKAALWAADLSCTQTSHASCSKDSMRLRRSNVTGSEEARSSEGPQIPGFTWRPTCIGVPPIMRSFNSTAFSDVARLQASCPNEVADDHADLQNLEY